MVGKKDKYLAAAQKFIERGQLDKALGEFTKVVQEDPKDTRTWLKMAELHAKRGANAEATEIYLRTGDLYAEQGFSQKAVAVYKNVLKLSPGTVPAHMKLGALFKQLGLMSDAVQQMELAANALQRTDKPQDAVAALRQAIEIQPDNVVLRVRLAESASGAGLTEEAVREFGRAADQLKAQGRTDESLRVLERLLFHQPQNFSKARELAEAYIAKGSPRLALPKLQACLNGDPRDPRTLSLLAKALEQLGQVPKAVSVLKELARLCGDLGRTSERDAAILRGLTLDPTDVELRAAAARSQLRGTSAIQGDATPPPAGVPDRSSAGGGSFDLSGVVRMAGAGASGRVVAAIGAADSGAHVGSPAEAPGQNPDVSRILAEADVFVKYGLLERAVDHLGRVFELEPEQRDARERLIAVLQRLGRKEDAASHIEILARQLAPKSPKEAKKWAEKALLLNPHAHKARALFDELSGPATAPLPGIALDVDDSGVELLTPPAIKFVAPAIPSAPRKPSTVGATDFEQSANTGDVLLASELDIGDTDQGFDEDIGEDMDEDIDEDIDDGIDLITPVPVSPAARSTPSKTSGAPATDFDEAVDTGDVLIVSDLDTGDVDEDADPGLNQLTPLPLPRAPERVPPGAGHPRGVLAAGGDVAESGDAFSEAAETIAGGMEHPVMTIAAMDEDELSGEMEQVSFFIEQSMFDEARGLLEDLEVQFPRDPRVAAKLRDLQASDARLGALFLEAAVAPVASRGAVVGATMIRGPSADATPAPRAVVEGGDVPDFSTHADLAVAYKGMGLFDAAIGELKQLCQDPGREVFALTTMGECYEAKGTFTEAVIRYKRALNCEQITRDETLELYFLLGGAFERLGDVGEALYFYEKVAKRDPTFRGVTDKVAELKPRMVKRAR